MTFKPNKSPEPEPEPRSGVEPGDHLYVHHQGQPRSGKVMAHGRHGVTLDIDGKHHKVKWDKVLGHKSRAPQNYAIIDRGEDGMVVEDKDGRRRYVAVPNEAKEDPMVAKSFCHARPVTLFVKAKPPGSYTGAPGLSKKQITDKRGVQTTKWVRTNKDDEPAESGQHVGFVNGAHKGHGQVTASGGNGVTVKDAEGGEHRVKHKQVTHRADGAGAPSEGPHESAVDSSAPANAPGEIKPSADGADAIARALFNTSELDKLPGKVFQPVSTWAELEEKGKEGLQQYTVMLSKVAKSLNLVTGKRPQSLDHAQKEENEKAKAEGREPKKLEEVEYMLPEHWDDARGYLFMGPLKGEKRAKEKVKADYKGDWSKVCDMVRATIAVPTVMQIPKVLAELKAAGVGLAQKPKNNLIKPLPGGYRDLNLIVRLPNGLFAEMQVHVKPMTLAKEKGHKFYETSRSIEGRYNEAGIVDSKNWSPEDLAEHEAAMKEQEKLYNPAWEKASKGTTEIRGTPNLTKAMKAPKVIFFRKASFISKESSYAKR